MRVAVFGLGYVGTVTAACLAANGHQVCGVDLDAEKVALVSAGRSPVVEPGLDRLVREGRASGRLRATTSAAEAVGPATVSLLCVGTPSDFHGGTDLRHVHRVVADLGLALRKRRAIGAAHVAVMRSTVPPGTVERIGDTLRAAAGDSGSDVKVAMCPEFLREGTGVADFYSPPYTVIGAADPDVPALLHPLFSFIHRPVRVVDIRTAEALKYASNAFHAVKISFANELGRALRASDVDSREVMKLFCEDDRLNISSSYLRPGFAFGGSCLPKDLRSLLHMARMQSIDLPMLAGVLATNRLSVNDVVDRVVQAPGRTVALLGLSFKMDSDDLRESPYVELAETLVGKGYALRIYDPIVHPARLIGANRVHVESKLPHLRSVLVASPEESLLGADTAIVSIPAPEVVSALLRRPPTRILDLDGRLGPRVESLDGYEGVAW